MRDEVADLVYPVFRYGLDLKEHLERGEAADMEKAQLELKKLLTDKRWTELDEGGNLATSSVFATGKSMGAVPAGRGTSFQGIRYALVSWLDEVFVLDSPWGSDWTERTLEVALYGTRERAYHFWDQAEKAESRPGSDALEVYYLCALLGFRGDNRDRPEKLRGWIERVRPQIIRSHGQEPSQNDKSEPDNNVPLLSGRERFQTMFKAWGGVLLLLMFVLGFFLVYQFAK